MLRTQVDGSDESTVLAARDRLNHAYDSFVARFGPISMRTNIAAFRGDPDRPLLLSLEHYDEDTKTAKKTAIFRERNDPVPKTGRVGWLGERGITGFAE